MENINFNQVSQKKLPHLKAPVEEALDQKKYIIGVTTKGDIRKSSNRPGWSGADRSIPFKIYLREDTYVVTRHARTGGKFLYPLSISPVLPIGTLSLLVGSGLGLTHGLDCVSSH